MLTKQTLEVRWFNRGQIPENIQHWFWQNCLGKLEQAQEFPEEREDYYLYLPDCHILSFKFRQENIEIKWRKDELGFYEFSNQSLGTWKGKIERWLKLDYTQDSLQTTLYADDRNKTWIKVKKKRWQRFYKNIEFEIAHLEIGQFSWWTMAAEMEENSENTENFFNQVITEFNQTYSGNQLCSEISYGYPLWLLQLISHK